MSDKRPDNMPGDVPEPLFDVSIPDTLLDGLVCCDPVEWAESADAPELVSFIQSLRQPAQPHELSGEAVALAAFREASRRGASPLPSLRSRMTHASRRAKVIAAVLIGSVGVGTATAAAVQGELPAPLQQFAHVVFGAPSPNSDDDSGGADYMQPPTDAPELWSQNVTQQPPYEPVPGLLVTESDASGALPAPGVTPEDSTATEPDGQAPGSTASPPEPDENPPADEQEGSHPVPPPVPPPDAGDAGGPPPASGQSGGPAPQAQAAPGTQSNAVHRPNVGKPTSPGPPAGAGQPQGSGQPESAGRPASVGQPADPGPPPSAGQPPADTQPAEPQLTGGPPNTQGGPPAEPGSGNQPPPAKP